MKRRFGGRRSAESKVRRLKEVIQTAPIGEGKKRSLIHRAERYLPWVPKEIRGQYRHELK